MEVKQGPDEERPCDGCSVSFRRQGGGTVGFNWGEMSHDQFFILQRSSGCNVDTGENGRRPLGLGSGEGRDR